MVGRRGAEKDCVRTGGRRRPKADGNEGEERGSTLHASHCPETHDDSGVRTEAEALAALDDAATTPTLLASLAEALTSLLGAEACLISRAIGEMLVDLVEHTTTPAPLPGGHGYLISDFPQTQRILKDGTSATVFIDDPEADRQETALLKELGFTSLLMAPIMVRNDTWGLAEVYGHERFADADVKRVQPLLTRSGELISELRA